MRIICNSSDLLYFIGDDFMITYLNQNSKNIRSKYWEDDRRVINIFFNPTNFML